MKKLIYLIVPLIALLSGCSLIKLQQSQGFAYDREEDFRQRNARYAAQIKQVFFDELSPYGNWIDYPDYGYVWVPAVDYDFKPYVTNGSWVFSDYGWTWASNYEWGWATFHYGRWFFDDYYGWIWAPGDEWAPAWVKWGTADGYYCWAPLAPNGINPVWDNYWAFVPGRRFTDVNLSRSVFFDDRLRNNIQVIDNYNRYDRSVFHNGANGFTEYNRGPQLIDVETTTNRRVGIIGIDDYGRPGATVITNNQIRIYRPLINTDVQTDYPAPAPRVFDHYKDKQYRDNDGYSGRRNNQQWNNDNDRGRQNDRNEHDQNQQRNDGQSPVPGVNLNTGQGQTQRNNSGQQQNQHGNNGQNQQNGNNPDSGQQQNQHGNNGQNQQNGNNPNNGQGQNQHGNNGQNQQNGNNPNNGQGQNQHGNNSQNQQNGNNPNNGQGQIQQGNNGQQQNGNNPNNGQGQNQRGYNGQGQQNPRPGVYPNASQPPAQQQPVQQQGGNQNNQPAGQNPALRPNLQPVHLPNKSTPAPKPKLDTTRRRPAIQ